MCTIGNSKLFGLLADASEAANEEMQSAYVCFTEYMKAVVRSENDRSELFRTLNIIRIEFDALGASPLYGQGKKCPEIRLA